MDFLTNTLINIIAVIGVLGVMIFVHELGHFMAAKFFGVRVETFSLGFGRRLFGWKKGDTDYRVSVLPLGGYVKMSGENPGEALTGDPGEFMAHPRWQRFFIAVMGPAMNIVLAVVLLTGLYMVKYQKPAFLERGAQVGHVEKDSAADKAGIRPGDRIVRLDGLENPKWEAVEIRVVSNPGQKLELTVDREGGPFTTTLVPDTERRNRLGVAGWTPYVPMLIQGIESGYPGEKAGLRLGDEVVAINGQKSLAPRLLQIVQESKGKPVTLTVQRKGEKVDVAVVPIFENQRKTWRIGVAYGFETIDRRLSLGAALRESIETNKKFTALIFDFVRKMFEGKMSPRSVEGPIGIARLSGQAARQGVPDLINVMAAISLNLGIFNLFPIPILDGGVIVLLAIEGLMRRDLSLAVKERIFQVGFVFLVLIAVFVIYNDIVKSLPARFEKMLP